MTTSVMSIIDVESSSTSGDRVLLHMPLVTSGLPDAIIHNLITVKIILLSSSSFIVTTLN